MPVVVSYRRNGSIIVKRKCCLSLDLDSQMAESLEYKYFKRMVGTLHFPSSRTSGTPYNYIFLEYFSYPATTFSLIFYLLELIKIKFYFIIL